jgi:hypothetical protein
MCWSRMLFRTFDIIRHFLLSYSCFNTNGFSSLFTDCIRYDQTLLIFFSFGVDVAPTAVFVVRMMLE